MRRLQGAGYRLQVTGYKLQGKNKCLKLQMPEKIFYEKI